MLYVLFLSLKNFNIIQFIMIPRFSIYSILLTVRSVNQVQLKARKRPTFMVCRASGPNIRSGTMIVALKYWQLAN